VKLTPKTERDFIRDHPQGCYQMLGSVSIDPKKTDHYFAPKRVPSEGLRNIKRVTFEHLAGQR
jgi:hypothetical protein